jgi:hypothetical protein
MINRDVATPKEYWALEPDLQRFGRDLKDRRDAYTDNLQATGRWTYFRRAAALFFGSDPDNARSSATPTFGGGHGELVNMRGNVFRALIKQQHILVTGSRLAFQARPIAYDAQATETVTVANAWCDRILDDHAEEQLSAAALYTILYGEGWISAVWDETRGDPIGVDPMTGGPMTDPQTGAIVYTGEWRCSALRPDEVIRDPDVTDGNHLWLGVLRQHNRWALAQRFPQHRDAILNANDTQTTNMFRTLGLGVGANIDSRSATGTGSGNYSDQVVVVEFYHKACEMMPQGRMAWLIGDTILADGPNRYGDLPVYSMIIGREPTGAFGYGDAWDLMGPQQWYDSILTQVATTRENFGLRNIFVQTGSGLEPEMVSQGLRIISGTSAPVSVDLEQDATAQGANALQLITGIMQMITGLNDAALGNAGKSTSGAALAMQSQIAQQFNSGFQRAYAGLFEKVMTSAIRSLHTFSTAEYTVHVIGKNRQGVAKRFHAADLAMIDGIRAEVGNPALRSVGMRVEVANQLLASKMLPSPEAYLEMISTGRTEPALEGPRALEAQIERENEMLNAGQIVPVMVTDHHAEHIRQHAADCTDPETRNDPQRMALKLAHIQEHGTVWASASMDPMGVSLLTATGQQPSPAAAMMQAMAMAQAQMGAPPAPGAGPNPGPAGPAPTNPPVPQTNTAQPTPGGPEMPRPPAGAPPMM